MTARPTRLLYLSLCALALGCGIAHGPNFKAAFSAGHRARTAGRHAEAAQQFATAAHSAKRAKDRNEAQYLEARMYERLERWPIAMARYRSLQNRGGWRAGRAAFELARITIAHGDENDGYVLLGQALSQFPDHGVAHGALRKWIERRRQTHGEAQLQKALADWLSPLADTELHQQLLYEIARSLEREGKLHEALAAFVRCAEARPYPRGPFTDDAYWNASLLAEKLGQHDNAIGQLQAMLRNRERSSLLFGSYERPRFPAAQMRIAELYRDRLGNLQAAQEAFRRTHKEHTASILADDAMWQEAAMWRKLGDSAESCGVLTDLIDRFSSSRYVSCVAELCPHLRPPAGTRPHCPEYIKQGLR
jgi:tetratricopeptide (TPR) repeat protein